MRTNLPHVFAIGDLVRPHAAHKAMHEAKVAAEVAAGHKSYFDARVLPSVAYTDPEVAWVGLTETDAKKNGTQYKKGQFPWSASGRALALGRDEGFSKLLFDPVNHRVLGGGMVGPNAGELVAEVALAIEMGADATDIGPRFTASDLSASWALGRGLRGTITDLYMPKKA
jgi:dihydrolipoamide dehydrogenase